MKILILGSSGRLGNLLYKSFKSKHKVFNNGLKKENMTSQISIEFKNY